MFSQSRARFLIIALILGTVVGCTSRAEPRFSPARDSAAAGTRQSCLAQCNRSFDICGDTQSGSRRDRGTVFTGTEACQAQLRSCLERCRANP